MSPDTPAGPAVTVLLIIALFVCVMSSLGLLVMKGFYNKLHYLAPPAILGTAAIAAAVLVQEGFGSTAIKAGLVLAVMAITNPILTFAAARAKHVRDLQVEAEEKPDEETTISPPPPEETASRRPTEEAGFDRGGEDAESKSPRPPGEGQG